MPIGENMERVTKIIIKTTSGYCFFEDAFEDKIVITDHSVHYEFRPEFSGKLKPVSWTAKALNPEHLALFQKLANAVMKKIENPMPIQICDVGVITFALTFADKNKKSQEYCVLPDNLEPCFTIMKQIVRLATAAPSGMFYEEYDEDN